MTYKPHLLYLTETISTVYNYDTITFVCNELISLVCVCVWGGGDVVGVCIVGVCCGCVWASVGMCMFGE